MLWQVSFYFELEPRLIFLRGNRHFIGDGHYFAVQHVPCLELQGLDMVVVALCQLAPDMCCSTCSCLP